MKTTIIQKANLTLYAIFIIIYSYYLSTDQIWNNKTSLAINIFYLLFYFWCILTWLVFTVLDPDKPTRRFKPNRRFPYE